MLMKLQKRTSLLIIFTSIFINVTSRTLDNYVQTRQKYQYNILRNENNVLGYDNNENSNLNHEINQKSDENETCYAFKTKPYLYFSSKTNYDTVYQSNDVDTVPGECQPKQIWMLLRHGARYPLQKKMKAFHELTHIRNRIVSNHEHRNRGDLCQQDIENLKRWTLEDIPLSESDHLTNSGYDDLWKIGSRIRRKFYTLLNNEYSLENFRIKYTKHVKTKDSAEAFAHGLFSRRVNIPVPTKDDMLSKIYPDCSVLPIPGADDPADGTKGTNERHLFDRGPLIKEVIQNVSVRLGYSHHLSLDEITTMYDMCRYAKAWNVNDMSPWCACFSDDELKVLEYTGDLAYYYNSGHGYSGNLRTGCPLVKDMFDRFRDLATNSSHPQPHGVFYFGHSTTMYNLFARLGLAKDDFKITHDNYYKVMNRKWHTSLIAPFSGNFAAVFLKCSSGAENRIIFYHNEMPFKFNGCHGYECDWRVFEKMYKDITDPSVCNYNFCEEMTESNFTTTNTPINEMEELSTQKDYPIILDNNNHLRNKNENKAENITKDNIKNISTNNINNKNNHVNKFDENISGLPTIEKNNVNKKLSNAIIKEGHFDQSDENKQNYKILHRKVTKTDVEYDNSDETALKYSYDYNNNNHNKLAFSRKISNWNDKEIHLYWLFVSVSVCIVVLVLCNHYQFSYSKFTNRKKQQKIIKISYEKMGNIQLKGLQE